MFGAILIFVAGVLVGKYEKRIREWLGELLMEAEKEQE